MLRIFLAVFLGGGLGSVMRYGIQMLMHERIVAYNFPWATFTVNIIGSFLIGLFYALSAKFQLPEDVRLFLTAGLCGGFTTFSTFSNDVLEMFRQGNAALGIVYVVLSILLGLLACFIGASVCRS